MRYLSDIAETVRGYHAETVKHVEAARRREHLRTARELVGDAVDEALRTAEQDLPAASAALLDEWPRVVEAYSGDEMVVKVRDKELRTQLTRETLSGNKVPRVALPRFREDAELLRFLRSENLPGRFPFTAGVFPFKREGEDPGRMFAGEATRSAPTAASSCCPSTRRPSGCPPRSTPSRSTGATRTPAPTSTARSARPASRSRRSTT